MLIEKTLFGAENKVEKSIERLKYYEPENGYWLAYSGGKDSDVILELAKMATVKYKAHYNVTTIDPPELVRYIKKEHPEVIFKKPEMHFLTCMIEKKHFPPLRHQRWCCEIYKEGSGNGYIITGIRAEESPRRRKRKIIEHCYKGGQKKGHEPKIYIHPIFDWSTEDVWEFHKLRNIKHCNLYDKGKKRLGCLFCPMAKQSERTQDCIDYPKYLKIFKKAFNKLYEKRKDKMYRFKSGDDLLIEDCQ